MFCRSSKDNAEEYSKYTLYISLCYNDITSSSTPEEQTGSEDTISTEVTTTKIEETATTNTIESSETEDDGEESTPINVIEDDEILTIDKKKKELIRYLLENNNNNNNNNGIDMMNIINETINEFYLKNRVIILNTSITITSENDNNTLNIKALLLIENKYNEIASLLEESINIDKNTSFYNLISNKCNNIYSYCLITDIPTNTETTDTSPTVPIITECIYPLKSVFIYGTGIKIITNNNSLSNNNNDNNNNIKITYSSSSNSDCVIDKNSGNIAIDTNQRKTDGFIKCIITCSYENIKDEIALFQYKITEYKPSVDILLSSFPYNIYQNEEFDVILTLVYPIITDLSNINKNDNVILLKPNLNISIDITSENNKYILQDGPIYKTSKTIFEYNNLIITNSSERVLKINEKENDDDDDENDKITFNFMNESTNIFTSDKIDVIGIKNTQNCKKEERDKMGLCCKDITTKECLNGLMCKNLTFIIPFINDIDSELYDSYYRIFDDIIFKDTNYLWYSLVEQKNKKVLVVKINILNSTVKSNTNRLLLSFLDEKEEVNRVEKEKNIFQFEDYNYIKIVLSILECTDEVEIEERINVLPIEIKEILVNSNLDSKMKILIKEINEVSERTGNRIDYNVGITSQFDYKSEDNNNNNNNDDDDDDENKKKKWYEEIYVLVVIGIVVLLIIVIIVSYILAYIGQKIEEKKMRKNEVSMQNVVPIEKIKDHYNCNDLIYLRNNHKIIMEGYLMKESHDRIYDKYQRRYCVLYCNPAVLRIYGSMTPSYYGKVYLDEKQSIPLECYNGIEYEEGSNEFTMKLKIRESYLMTYEPGDKEIKMSFKVDEEIENSNIIAKEWVENIKNYKNAKPVVSEAWTKAYIMNENENNSESTKCSTEYYKGDNLG